MTLRIGTALLLTALLAAGVAITPSGPPVLWKGVGFISEANAQSMIRDLIARLRGETMPTGIVKSNGRLEATQVDVSSKYLDDSPR